MSRSTDRPIPAAPRHSILTQYRTKLDPIEGGDSLYLKVLSDEGRDDRERYALIESARERRALRDATSAAHAAYIAPIEDLSDDELLTRIEISAAQTVWLEVWIELPDDAKLPAEPTLPADASLEQREDALLAPLDADAVAAERLERERQALYRVKMESRKASAAFLSRPERIQAAQDAAVSQRAEMIYRRAIKRATVALATYADADCTQRLWDLADDAATIPGELVAALYDAYREVGEISPSFSTAKY